MAIPGSWTLYYSWGCGSSYSTVPWTLNADGTWSAPGYTGRGALTAGMFLLTFSGSDATYGGITAENVMAGTMATRAGTSGCWYAKKTGTTPLTAAKAGAVADMA